MPEVRGVAVPVRAVSGVRVRMAAPADWPAVAGLLVELGRGVAAGTAADPTHQLQFAGHIRRIENVTLIAEDDDGIVGVIDMEYHQRLGDHRPQARVHDLVVTERARGVAFASEADGRSCDTRGCVTGGGEGVGLGGRAAAR